MPFGNSIQRSRTTTAPAVLQSQRDCVCQPRVARNELPWVAARSVSNPNGVVSRFHGRAATPLGLLALAAMSQGSSSLATLGFRLESLWDSVPEFAKGMRIKPELRTVGSWSASVPSHRRPTRQSILQQPLKRWQAGACAGSACISCHGRMQSAVMNLAGVGYRFGTPEAVTGSPFSIFAATSCLSARSWASKSFFALKP
jgi:hypothetical protein